MLSRRYKFCKALELIPCHRSITAALEGEVSLEVRIEVLLERNVADQSHSTKGAVKLDAGEDLALGCLRGANDKYKGES